MRSRSLVLPAVLIALLLVCGLCGLTVYGGFAWANSSSADVRIFEIALVSAEVTTRETFPAADRLVIRSDAGDITVTAAEVSQIEVEMQKKAWGSDETEAQAAAEALPVQITESEGTLTLVFDPPESFGLISNRGGSDLVHFTVRAPQDLAVELRTAFGDIELEGTAGDAVLDTRFGDVTARSIRGAVRADSSNADIFLEGIDAGQGEVRAGTSFGSLTVEEVSAGDIFLETSNGDIKARTLESQNLLEASTSFGGITIQGLAAGSLSVVNRNGPIRLEDGQVSGELAAETQFGDIDVLEVAAGGYSIGNSNGTIEVDGASGLLDLQTSFGGIEVRNASGAILKLESSNGSLRFSGILDPTASHRLETSFGDIHLVIAPESAFNLSLETSFGRIRSDIPVTRSGEFSGDTTNSQWNATINGGGPELMASTSNGDVTIEVLEVP